MADDYPGIEIRVTRYKDDGPEIIFEGDSHLLHFQLMSMWLANGDTGHEWYPIRGGYMLGELLLEIRAVNLPELAAAPDYPADLFRGVPGALGELAELERAAAGRIAERAAAAECCCVCGRPQVDYRNYREDPFCWPCADGKAPGVGDVDQAAADQEVSEPWLAELAASSAVAYLDTLGRIRADTATPVVPFPYGTTGVVDPGAGPGLLTELDQPTVPPRRLERAGTVIARIARRARFLSGR